MGPIMEPLDQLLDDIAQGTIYILVIDRLERGL